MAATLDYFGGEIVMHVPDKEPTLPTALTDAVARAGLTFFEENGWHKSSEYTVLCIISDTAVARLKSNGDNTLPSGITR
jgi:hypothetical protein